MTSKTWQLTEALGQDVARALGDGWTVTWGVPRPDDEGGSKLTTTGKSAAVSLPVIQFTPDSVSPVKPFSTTWIFEILLSVTAASTPEDAADPVYGGAEAIISALASPQAGFKQLDYVDYLDDVDVEIDKPWLGAFDPPMSIAVGVTLMGRS